MTDEEKPLHSLYAKRTSDEYLEKYKDWEVVDRFPISIGCAEICKYSDGGFSVKIDWPGMFQASDITRIGIKLQKYV